MYCASAVVTSLPSGRNVETSLLTNAGKLPLDFMLAPRSRSTSTPSRLRRVTNASKLAAKGAMLDCVWYWLMIPISSSAPPIETRTLTFFAWAAAVSVFTSLSAAPKFQLFPESTVPNARRRCVILLKSILVAQVAKLPAQFGKYMTTLVPGVVTGASGAPPSRGTPASALAVPPDPADPPPAPPAPPAPPGPLVPLVLLSPVVVPAVVVPTVTPPPTAPLVCLPP